MIRPAARTLCLIVLLGGCAGEQGLGTPERFTWCEGGPSLSVALPAGDWRRAKHQARASGVSLVRGGAPPAMLTVGEYLGICKQDPRPAVRALAARFDAFGPGEFQRAAQAGHRFVDAAYSNAGEEVLGAVNAALTRAQIAHRRGDFEAARADVAAALTAAEALAYSLDELVGPYLVTAAALGDPARYFIADPAPQSVGGEAAVSIDFEFDADGHTYHGRQVHVARDGHLFVFSYRGPEDHLPLFAALLETVSFH